VENSVATSAADEMFDILRSASCRRYSTHAFRA
jgi:hypothetical protein